MKPGFFARALALACAAFVTIAAPAEARFLQVDPVGYDDQINLYTYVGNDPLNHTDPTGQCMSIVCATYLYNSVKDDPVGALINVGTAVAIAIDVADGPVPDVGAAAVAARTARIERLQANAVQGAKGEAATAAKLGDKAAGKQVSFKTSDGTRTRADFVTKDKGVVETKTGNAGLTKGQEKLHGDIRAGREVTPVGRNARDAGLEPGKPTRMNGCSIDRPAC